jgi:rhodanese domain protein
MAGWAAGNGKGLKEKRRHFRIARFSSAPRSPLRAFIFLPGSGLFAQSRPEQEHKVDFILANWLLILVALVSGAMLFVPALSGQPGAATVTPAEAVHLMNREKAAVIDVREAAEFATGHIANARHVPLAELAEKLPAAVKNKTLPLVLCCASGRRSAAAVAVAKKLGHEKAVSLAGGLKAWREAGLPVEKS